MNKFYFNKKRIVFGLVFFATFNIISIWFIKEPEIFIRNFIMREWHIRILGILIFMYSVAMLWSFLILFFRKKEALVISEGFLIDNSKFESVGVINFSEIVRINRKGKNSLEIVLKEPVFKSKRLNLLQKIIHMANNWNYRSTIVVSGSLLNCDIVTLEKAILIAMKRHSSKLS